MTGPRRALPATQCCPTCGIESFARGSMPDGTPTVAVNVRCLAGVEPTELQSIQYDGRSR